MVSGCCRNCRVFAPSSVSLFHAKTYLSELSISIAAKHKYLPFPVVKLHGECCRDRGRSWRNGGIIVGARAAGLCHRMHRSKTEEATLSKSPLSRIKSPSWSSSRVRLFYWTYPARQIFEVKYCNATAEVPPKEKLST